MNFENRLGFDKVIATSTILGVTQCLCQHQRNLIDTLEQENILMWIQASELDHQTDATVGSGSTHALLRMQDYSDFWRNSQLHSNAYTRTPTEGQVAAIQATLVSY